MQLITEAWHNLPPGERAPFDSRARDDMQRYLQEERVYDQMQMQYSRLKQMVQQSGVLAAAPPQQIAAGQQQQLLRQPQSQRQPPANNAQTAGQLLEAYSQAASQGNYRPQQTQQILQQYAMQQQHQAAAAAQMGQQRQHQAQHANNQQQKSALLLALANAVDRNSAGGRISAAPPPPQARQQQQKQPPPSSTLHRQYHPSSGGRNRPNRAPETVEIVCNGVNGTLIIKDQNVVCGCSVCFQLPQNNRTMSCSQFEIHAGAGGKKKWKNSIKVRPGNEPEVPRNAQPMPVGRWLELRGFEVDGASLTVTGGSAPTQQINGGQPGSFPPSSGPTTNKLPLQYQWKGGPGGGAFAPVAPGGGGAFAPPLSFKGNTAQQQKNNPPKAPQQHRYAERYSAAAVASRQQERAAAAAATAPAPVGRPPSAANQYRNSAQGTITTVPAGKASHYTPWKDANDGKFSSINVRWSGERCSVCDADTDFDNDQLVTCDMCGITVHQSCYGVQDVPGVEVMWFCRACELHNSKTSSSAPAAQCCLCPVAGGALKPTIIQGVWAHVVCLQWIPEVSVDNAELMEPISGIRSIERDRWELLCYICKQRMGAKIQCKSCYNAYHPLCARIAGFRMEIKEGPRGPDGPVVCTSFCGKHSTPRPQLAGVRKVEDSEAGGDLPDQLEKPRLWNCQPYPLAKCMPVPDCSAGCARAMVYDLSGRGLIRKQHGCGTGATTEAAFWIPGSVFEDAQDSEKEELKQNEGEAGDQENNKDPMDGDGDEGSKNNMSTRSRNKRKYNDDGPGSAAGDEQEEEIEIIDEQQDKQVVVVQTSGKMVSETPANPPLPSGDGIIGITTADDATNKQKPTAAAIDATNSALIQRVDSPPGMRTVETALRPALKQSSAINGERPPAKLRKLNNLQENPSSFTPPTTSTADEGDDVTAAAAPVSAPQALVAGRLPADLVGHWCRIWWPEDNEWYLGGIREYSPARGQFRIWYEVDNEAEWIDLGREARNNRVQLLDGDDRSTWAAPLPTPTSGREPAAVKAEDGNGGTFAAAGIKNENGEEEDEEEHVLVVGPAEGAAAVGRTVGIYWDGANQYYYGTIRRYSTEKGHLIVYENGTTDWVDLNTSRVEWKDLKKSTGTATLDAGGGNNNNNNNKSEADGGTTDPTNATATGGCQDVMDHKIIDKHIAVVCNGVRGIFHSKTLTVTLTHSGKEVTPGEFERLSGRGSAKKWKSTIRIDDGDGIPGKAIESWLILLGLWKEDGKPVAVKIYSGNRLMGKESQLQLQGECQLRPTRATAEAYSRRRQPTRNANNGKSVHKGDCSCVICKQSRRTGNNWAGFAAGSGGNPPRAAGAGAAAAGGRSRNTTSNSAAVNNNTARRRVQSKETAHRHNPNALRTGKQAYLEAMPQIISTGPRALELYQAPPSRCWAPGEWAAHRLRYNMAREAKLKGQNNSSLASLGHSTTPPVIISGGSLAIRDDNIATLVSLGPGATGGGRTLTLKEKLDLCNATEHERLAFGKSGIHGWGLFAKVPMRQDTMVVEFRGELLRRSAAETREAKYLAQGADCYIFNLDDDVVLDATKAGTIARFTNHSCSPSLYTKILALEGELRLAFFAREDIAPGQEMTYNYRFKAEEDEEKMMCHCGAPNCTGYLN
jgi:hypothetical protein